MPRARRRGRATGRREGCGAASAGNLLEAIRGCGLARTARDRGPRAPAKVLFEDARQPPQRLAQLPAPEALVAERFIDAVAEDARLGLVGDGHPCAARALRLELPDRQ